MGVGKQQQVQFLQITGNQKAKAICFGLPGGDEIHDPTTVCGVQIHACDHQPHHKKMGQLQKTVDQLRFGLRGLKDVSVLGNQVGVHPIAIEAVKTKTAGIQQTDDFLVPGQAEVGRSKIHGHDIEIA